jgi:hypothetical protein
MSYSDFVKSTFAYTHKKFGLTFNKEECEKIHASLNPVNNQGIETYDYTQTVAFNLLKELKDLQHKHDIIHCAYGILNEYVEYMNEFIKYINLVETLENNLLGSQLLLKTEDLDKQLTAIEKEIGDIYYYKTMLLNLLGIDQPITDVEWTTGKEEQIVEALADLIKKYVYYSHELNVPAIKQACFDMDRCFNHICKKLGTSLAEIIAQNEAKLRARYPSGTFTSQDAAAKADTK